MWVRDTMAEEFRYTRHAKSLSGAEKRVCEAIERCRTAAIGGHLERWDNAPERNAYTSCADPPLPKRQVFSDSEAARNCKEITTYAIKTRRDWLLIPFGVVTRESGDPRRSFQICYTAGEQLLANLMPFGGISLWQTGLVTRRGRGQDLVVFTR